MLIMYIRIQSVLVINQLVTYYNNFSIVNTKLVILCLFINGLVQIRLVRVILGKIVGLGAG